jgi:hypothetical protein
MIDNIERSSKMTKVQTASLFKQNVEFLYVKSVIGSGYEDDVSRLALEDSAPGGTKEYANTFRYYS